MLSLAANKRPLAGNQVFFNILCSGFATRDFARQFEVLQGSNCTDCDSGECSKDLFVDVLLSL